MPAHPRYARNIGAKKIGPKFEHGRLPWRLLLVGLVVLVARYYPSWHFDHMTADEHLEAARIALAEQKFGEALHHVNALSPGALETVNLKRELATAQAAARQTEGAQQAEQKSQRVAVGELQHDLRNRGYDVTVTRSGSPGEIIIESKRFDEPGQRERFLAFLRGVDGPTAAACDAGIQTVRLKGPGLFFGISDSYWLDCYTK